MLVTFFNDMKILPQKGYTLPETLVYIAVFAGLSAALVNALIVSAGGVRALRTTRQTTRAVELAFDRIAREIRSSAGVATSTSVLGTHPSTVTLSTGVEVKSASSTLYLRLAGSSTSTLLLPEGVQVTQFIAKRLVASSSEAVRIESIIGGENYTLTVVARGSY